jgi:hypothetical protein
VRIHASGPYILMEFHKWAIEIRRAGGRAPEIYDLRRRLAALILKWHDHIKNNLCMCGWWQSNGWGPEWMIKEEEMNGRQQQPSRH